MLKMANAASAQALDEFKKRLREFLETSETGRQAIAVAGSESFELQHPQRPARQRLEVDSDDDI